MAGQGESFADPGVSEYRQGYVGLVEDIAGRGADAEELARTFRDFEAAWPDLLVSSGISLRASLRDLEAAARGVAVVAHGEGNADLRDEFDRTAATYVFFQRALHLLVGEACR